MSRLLAKAEARAKDLKHEIGIMTATGPLTALKAERDAIKA